MNSVMDEWGISDYAGTGDINTPEYTPSDYQGTGSYVPNNVGTGITATSDIPPWLKTLLGYVAPAYQIATGQPVSTSTQVGNTQIKTGMAAQTSGATYLLIIGAIALLAYFLMKK
jgi:hypothetical protein